MRLNKYIAHCGAASRRKADELVKKGLVRVNGKIAEIGQDVAEGDVVELKGKAITPEKRMVYYMLNKPTGYVTTSSDDQGRPTVLDLMPDISERIYAVGRLDYNTSGLLILTNDGDLAFRIMHPKSMIFKTYVAEVTGLVTMYEASKLRKGVAIDGHTTAPAEVEIIRQSKSGSLVEIRISEGRNRQVRRMFEAIGHRVVALERTAVGNMKMAHLKQGQFRKLSENEIKYLKNL